MPEPQAVCSQEQRLEVSLSMLAQRVASMLEPQPEYLRARKPGAFPSMQARRAA
jgi:hypothetical protein